MGYENQKLPKLAMEIPNATDPRQNDLQEKSTEEVVQFVVSRYHDDLRKRIPELILMAEKVERVHRDHPLCPQGLSALLIQMNQDLKMHMMKEENVLFPLLSSGRGRVALMPIKVMTLEHEEHVHHLEKLHQQTKDFHPPEGACTTWRALYQGLQDLEKELLEHIHLENDILFPRALTQE